MNAAYDLTGSVQILNIRLAVIGDLQTAVLIVEGGIDQDGFLADVDTVLAEHPHHGGDPLLDGTGAVLHFDHGGIEPQGVTFGRGDAVTTVGAFPDDGGGRNISCLQGVHEYFTIGIDQHGAHAADLLGDQRAVDLGGESSAGGMVLQCVGIQKTGACTVCQHQSVGGGAVVVGGGETLVMEPSGTAGGQDHGFGFGNKQLLGLHVHQNSAGAATPVVLDQFNGRSEVDDGDVPVQHFIPEGSHDLSAGIVFSCVHPLAGGAAAVGGDHGSVGGLVEFYTQFTQPADSLGRLVDQFVKKVLLRREMTAAESIQEVLGRGVAGLVGSLDAAFGHHGVGIADAKLGHDHDPGAVVVCFDGSRSAGSAAADDQHIGLVVGMLQIDFGIQNAGIGL